ncbi:MAG: hypothetical protein EYC70_05845 [Planctomycetota bacterium]|nr:MAG: hypothetical protein EYC70_05845 [Planctomycetota bacterium]
MPSARKRPRSSAPRRARRPLSTVEAVGGAEAVQGPVYTVAALPFDVRPGKVEHNLGRAIEGLEQAAAAGASLLALPEMWTTSFLPRYADGARADSDSALETMHSRAQELEITVIGSAPGGNGVKPVNELHVLGVPGLLRPYRKRVLFSPIGEGRQCKAGDGFPATLETPLGRVAGIICYDLRFPELTRKPFYDGADLLVVPAQWPVARQGVFELLAAARAAENQCWVLSCNRSGFAHLGDRRRVEFPGNATLVDPLGVVAAQVDDGELLVAEVDYGEMAAIRKRVPCARDLKKAGLEPRQPEFAA